jgi:hypothetical protein
VVGWFGFHGAVDVIDVVGCWFSWLLFIIGMAVTGIPAPLSSMQIQPNEVTEIMAFL